MKTIRRFWGDAKGQSLVEFALIMPLLLLIITGLFDVARATWQENTLAYAAREGTRYAIVHGAGAVVEGSEVYPGNEQPVIDVVRAAAIGVPNVSVVVTWPDSCVDRSCRVAVDATTTFIPIPSHYLLGDTFQITLKGGSELVIER